MLIRLAQAEDVAALAALDARCNPVPWSAKQFLAALNSPHDTVLLAWQDKQLAGFAVWQTVCDESELHLIATAPEYRRQGLAGQLMMSWQQACAEQGVRRLLLEVRDSNHAAQQLYVKHGFQAYTRRRQYYSLPDGTREDAVLMEQAC